MDFQNLGKHCSDQTCRQKDFLPFTCGFCQSIFCVDHRGVSAHNCPNQNQGDINTVECPICLKTLQYDAGRTNQQECWEDHFEKECQPENYERINAQRLKACSELNCKTKLTTLNTNICKDCHQEFCLKHRFNDKHECVRLRNTVLIEEEKVDVNASRRLNNSNANLIEENLFGENNIPREQDDDWETKEKYKKSTNQTYSSEESEPGLYRRVVDEHIKPFLERKDGYETILIVGVFLILYLISYYTAN